MIYLGGYYQNKLTANHHEIDLLFYLLKDD